MQTSTARAHQSRPTKSHASGVTVTLQGSVSAQQPFSHASGSHWHPLDTARKPPKNKIAIGESIWFKKCREMQLLRVENTKKSLSWEGDTRSVALRPRTTALCALAFQIRGKSHAQPVSELTLASLAHPPPGPPRSASGLQHAVVTKNRPTKTYNTNTSAAQATKQQLSTHATHARARWPIGLAPVGERVHIMLARARAVRERRYPIVNIKQNTL